MGALRSLRTLLTAARATGPALVGGDADAARRQLVARLGPLRGASTKVAQLLSARAGEDAGDEIDPVPLRELWPRIEAAAGRQLDGIGSVDPVGRTASLAQVHRATLRSGHEVALKVQLPGVADALRSDLGTLGWIGRRGAGVLARRAGRDARDGIEAWIDTIGDGLELELDLERELALQSQARGLLEDLDRGLRVPLVWPGISTPHVLAASWEPGHGIASVRSWSRPERETAARLVVRAVLRLALEGGLVHGDLHPGNVAWRRDDGEVRCILYDFGAAQELSGVEADAWRALLSGDGAADHALATLGFDLDVLAPIAGRLEELASVVFAPFRARGAFAFDAWRRVERVERLLGEHRLLPRIAAPPAALPFVRTLAGMLGLVGHLGASIGLAELLEEVGPTRAAGAPAAEATAEAGAAPGSSGARLVVELVGRGRADVRVTLPVRALAHLADLVPHDVCAALAEEGVELAALCREAATEERGILLDRTLSRGRITITRTG